MPHIRSLFPLAAAMLCLVACGRYVEPDLKPYVDGFYAASIAEHATIVPGRVEVRFGEPEGNAAALCRHGIFQTPTILVNESQWARASHVERMAIIYHELGHCELHREHRDDLLSDHVTPLSLMHSVAYPEPGAMRPVEEYVHELFHP